MRQDGKEHRQRSPIHLEFYRLLSGDFNGDGVAEAVLFRPSTHEWYVRFSSDGSVHSFGFGDNGDIPWAGYFTADGSIDQVLYRPSNGTFYIRDAATGVVTSSGRIETSSEILCLGE